MTIEMLKHAVEDGGESALVLLFCSSASTVKIYEDRIPFDPSTDTLTCDFKLLWGRADLVISHFDGSMMVIIAKDGGRGHDHVVAGIGDASLCAAQLALMFGAKVPVRAALLWSAAGDLLLDALIEDACLAANVTPLPWGPLERHLSAAANSINQFAAGASHLADVHAEAKGQVH